MNIEIPRKSKWSGGMEATKENFNKWNNALLTKDPKKVAALYSEDATFLPTMSGKLELGKPGAEGYFEHFLEKNPVGEIITDQVQTLSSNCYLHSGLYNFEIDDDDGSSGRKIIEARFSFVWIKNKRWGRWEILHHHSSVKPVESPL